MTMQVIGAGLGRTGTMSLKFALEHLGFGPCYHMIEFMAHIPDHLPLWLDVIEGRPNWDAVFDGYVSTVDYPGCTYWRELVAKWPEAKVILTLRDPDSWFESANEKVLSSRMRNMLAQTPIERFMNATVNQDFGDRIDDRAFMTDYFRRWNDAVIAEVPADKLLVFQAKDGWEPLCEFLGVPVPPEPYPRVNSREDMNARISQQTRQVQTVSPTVEQMAATSQARLAAMREMAFSTVV
ncbi:MAG: sulfotransferase family protein [Croceibacterium sp.]